MTYRAAAAHALANEAVAGVVTTEPRFVYILKKAHPTPLEADFSNVWCNAVHVTPAHYGHMSVEILKERLEQEFWRSAGSSFRSASFGHMVSGDWFSSLDFVFGEEVADAYDDARRSVKEIAQHGDATNASIERATSVVEWLEQAGVQPTRVIATAENGIAFYFDGAQKTPGGSSARYGLLECDEEGSIIALTKDRNAGAPTAWEPEPTAVDIDQAAHQIAAFINQ
jgi:hypothetical protein